MSNSRYGEWTSRGETIDAAALSVAARHQIHGTQCLCGFESFRSRSRTEHIIDATLSVLAAAGVLVFASHENGGAGVAEAPARLRDSRCSPVVPEAQVRQEAACDRISEFDARLLAVRDEAMHWVSDAPTSLHGNGAASFARTTHVRADVTCQRCLSILDAASHDDGSKW